MNTFLSSNEAKYRLLRTILQGIIGVIIANLDLLVGLAPIPPEVKPLIVALVMACLSPIMAYMGGKYDMSDLDAMGPGTVEDDAYAQNVEWELEEEVILDEPIEAGDL